MIQALYNIGKYIPKEYFQDNPLNLNLDYGKSGDKKIVFLKFNCEKEAEFTGIDVVDYDASKNKKHYLLKNAKGNSVSDFSTVFFEKASLNEDGTINFNSKSGKKLLKILNNNAKVNPKIKPIQELIEKGTITGKVELAEDFILSIKINDKTIGESEFFTPIKTSSLKNSFSRFYAKYKTESRSQNSTCSLCKKSEDTEIWGYVDLDDFKFYSSNEDSVIAGGFNKANSWKNYPVCSECASKMLQYKDVLQHYLSFGFYGYRYFLVPQIIFEDVSNQEIVNDLISEEYGLLKLKSLKDKMEVDEDILFSLKDTNNYLNYNLFFYEQNNSEFKILLSIDNVFPSRFKTIYEAKKIVENFEIFRDVKGFPRKGEIGDLYFHFELIKHFFPNNKVEGNYSSYFLEIVRSIFVGKDINYSFIIKHIIKKIRHSFSNGSSTEYDLLKAVMLIKFIKKLNLFNQRDKKAEKEIKVSENIYEAFFLEHHDFFDNNSKKAIFLEGILCQSLLDIQYKERNSTPFRSKLNGLKLDENHIKKLLPEIINKLEEYRKNYYTKLEALISEYMLGAKFAMTNDEISFYFVMGMNLAKNFKQKHEEGESNGDD